MGEPLFVFIALAGAALLGFLFSNAMSRRRTTSLLTENTDFQIALRDKESVLARLKSENEARLLAVENLQKISQEVENQVFERDKELVLMKNENFRLQQEVQHLTENPIEKIKEIDVIREVPIVILKEISIPETRKDKAKKLMKAFKKGYLDEHEELSITEEKADESV
jgi:hypothetical protein